MGLFGDPPLPGLSVTPSRPQLPFAPAAAARSAPAYRRPSLLERLLPVPPALRGILAPEDVQAARTQGLLGLGAGLLESSGWSPTPQSLGPALARGVQGGMQGFQGGLGQAAQMAQLAQSQQAAQRQMEVRSRIGKMLEGITDPAQRFQKAQEMMAAAVEAGDTEVVGALSQLVVAMKPDTRAAAVKRDWVDMGGQKVLVGEDGMPVRGPDGKPMTMQKTAPPRDPNAADPTAGVAAQRMFQREQQLADDYRSATKEHAVVGNSVSTMLSVGGDARRGDPYAQMLLIFNFMKANDPGSTVRETEYANAQNAAGVPEKIRNYWNKMLDGQFLGSSQVDEILGQVGNMARSWQSRQAPILQQYRTRAQRWGVNPDLVVHDHFGGVKIPEPRYAAPGPRAATAPGAAAVEQWLKGGRP
jgi:hypothetical protein